MVIMLIMVIMVMDEQRGLCDCELIYPINGISYVFDRAGSPVPTPSERGSSRPMSGRLTPVNQFFLDPTMLGGASLRVDDW